MRTLHAWSPDGKIPYEGSLLVADAVRKIYRTGAGEVWALHDVSLTVRDGEFVVPTLLAALLPARLASRIEPATALRMHD